eukprot:306554-Prymnesium_polylepis.1
MEIQHSKSGQLLASDADHSSSRCVAASVGFTSRTRKACLPSALSSVRFVHSCSTLLHGDCGSGADDITRLPLAFISSADVLHGVEAAPKGILRESSQAAG